MVDCPTKIIILILVLTFNHCPLLGRAEWPKFMHLMLENPVTLKLWRWWYYARSWINSLHQKNSPFRQRKVQCKVNFERHWIFIVSIIRNRKCILVPYILLDRKVRAYALKYWLHWEWSLNIFWEIFLHSVDNHRLIMPPKK